MEESGPFTFAPPPAPPSPHYSSLTCSPAAHSLAFFYEWPQKCLQDTLSLPLLDWAFSQARKAHCWFPRSPGLFPSPQVPPPLWDTVPALPQAVSRFQARTWIMAAETACFFAQNQKPAVTLTLAQTKDQFLL